MEVKWRQTELFLHVDMYNEAAVQLYTSSGYVAMPEFDAICRPPRPKFSDPVLPNVLNRYHRRVLVDVDHSSSGSGALDLV